MAPKTKDVLKSIPGSRRVAWELGRLSHHTVPSVLGRRNPTDDQTDRPSAPPEVDNPVLTGRDVTDYGDVKYVADPFLYVTDDRVWHLFFEIYSENRDPNAAIGHAISEDGVEWHYDQVVLDTGFHVSYPFLFESDGERYMVPEQNPDGGHRVTLYQASPFPREWKPVTDIITPSHPPRDPVLFEHDDRWYLIVSDTDRNDLYAYHAEDLETSDWTPHQANPVVTDRAQAGRPGGRPVVTDDGVLLFYQDCEKRYGHRVRAFRITELTESAYEDRELSALPIVRPGRSRFGWNSGAMHHIDPWLVDGTWWCAVDGNVGFGHEYFTDRHWAIGIYTWPGGPTLSEEVRR